MSNSAMRFLWPVLLWCLCCAPAAGKEYWNYKTAYDAYDRGESPPYSETPEHQGTHRVSFEIGRPGREVSEEFQCGSLRLRQAQ